MTGHALSTCSVLVLCLLGNAITGCGQATLSVDDAVLLEGQQTRFVGYLEREPLLGIRDGIEGARIRFLIDGREVGSADTDGDGGSSVACDIGAGRPSRFEARAIVAGQSLRSEGVVFHWRGDRVIVVVDIDGTIARTEFDDLIFDEEDDESRPVRHARETLRELSADFHIGYVTARPRFLLDKTRRWLARNGFPSGPVITAPRLRDQVGQTEYKRRTLGGLRSYWPNLLIGIGDTEVDSEAYGASGLLTLIVDPAQDDSFGPHAVVFRSWADVCPFFRATRGGLTRPDGLIDVIRGNTMLLQPAPPWRPSD